MRVGGDWWAVDGGRVGGGRCSVFGNENQADALMRFQRFAQQLFLLHHDE